MSDLKEKDPENEGSGQEEIESPTDGPPPDWMKTATSSAGSSFSDDEAPDWLKNIRAGKSTETEAEASEGDSAGAAEDDGLSDLERLLAEEGIDLTGVEDERPEEAEGMSVKDWMIATSDDEIIRKRIGAEPGEEPVPPPAPEPEPAEPAPQPEPPLAEPAPVPEPVWAAGDQDVVEEELPDWLREISDEVETSPPLETAPEPIAAVEEVEDDKMVVDEDLPDWLREVSAEVSAASPSVAPEPEPVSAVEEADLDQAAEIFEGEDLPDWLQGLSDEPAAAVEPEAAAPVTEEVVEEEMADWLQEVSDDAAQEVEEIVTATTDEDKLVVADELPSWLREVDETAEELPPTFDQVAPEPIVSEVGEDETSIEEEVPDWLQEAEDSSLEEEDFGPQFEAAPPSYRVTDSTDTIDEENLPDWLRDVQEDESEAVSESLLAEVTMAEDIDTAEEEDFLPDWLKEVQEEETPPEPAPEPALPVEPTPTPPTPEDELEEELPSWLQEAAAESVEASFEAEAVAESTDLEEMEEGELPDWLQEVQVAEEEPFEPSEPSPDELFTGEPGEEPEAMEEGLPDWLREVQEEELELPVVEEADLVAAVVPELTPEYAIEESLIEEKELPDWLQVEEEPEPEAEPVAIPPEPEPEVIEGAPLAPTPEEVAPAVEAVPAAKSISDLPDWLQKLREGDVEEEEVAPVEPLPKPAVVEPFAEVVSEPELATKPLAEPEVSVPEDASERLEMARLARDTGNIVEAVQFYESLVSSGLHLDRVIEDMQQTVKSYPANASLYQVMGDAMMKDGRLQSALDAYRQALTKL
jgi:hypothetical protein